MSTKLGTKRTLSSKIDANKDEIVANKSKKSRKHLPIEFNSDVKKEGCPKWEPSNWQQVIDQIRVMRKEYTAAVDNMGCDQAADKNEEPEV